MELTIRNEEPADYRTVEDVTRMAFWNVHAPGCDEHYLVHVLRGHPDFIPELDFVLLADGAIVGNIMYTRARLVAEDGGVKTVATFGPVSILPQHQRKGLGKRLIEHSLRKAALLSYDAVVIFGSPSNYVGLGFKSCARYSVYLEGDRAPTAMLVKELRPGALGGGKWYYKESEAYGIDPEEAARFDAGFGFLAKEERPSQEEFFILSRSSLKPPSAPPTSAAT